MATINPMATAKKPIVAEIQFSEFFIVTKNTIATNANVATSLKILSPVDFHLKRPFAILNIVFWQMK